MTYNYLNSKPEEQPGVRPGRRKCLKCCREFKSSGIHRRLCAGCRQAIKKGELRGYDETPTEVPIGPSPLVLSDMTYY